MPPKEFYSMDIPVVNNPSPAILQGDDLNNHSGRVKTGPEANEKKVEPARMDVEAISNAASDGTVVETEDVTAAETTKFKPKHGPELGSKLDS